MGHNAGDSYKAKVSDAGAPVFIDQDVRLRE